MVETILDAGIIVLEREGIAGFTTNRVAEVERVGVGSLYQYFANKEMILAGIVERGIIDAEAMVRSAIVQADSVPAVDVLAQLLDALLVSLEPYRDLLAEILSATPVLSGTGIAAMLETRFLDALRDFLVRHSGRYTLVGGLPAMYAAVNGAIYVALKWLSERPPHITREALVSVFVHQLRSLLVLGHDEA